MDQGIVAFDLEKYSLLDEANYTLQSVESTKFYFLRNSIRFLKARLDDHSVNYFLLMYRYGINTNILHLALHEKTYFIFPNVLKKSSFQKNCTGIDLSCIIRKNDISSSRKYDLSL